MEFSDFEEDFYLRMNKDVANAVNSGKIISGYSHYNKYGYKEYRAPNLKTYNENKYCLSKFCSLGVNCEFGMAQRRFHSEPVDLLRWANPTPDVLIKLFMSKFDRIADANEIEIRPDERDEFFVLHKSYNCRWHAWTKVGELSPEAILGRELRRIPFLAKKLIDELRSGERIFIVKQAGVTRYVAQEILNAMRDYGQPRLVYVTDGAPVNVSRVSDDLLHGTIPKFADGRFVGGPTLAGYDWLALCQRALATLGHVGAGNDVVNSIERTPLTTGGARAWPSSSN